ncbi:hypothetical protein Tco_0050352 [Tanacetum coccineum]
MISRREDSPPPGFLTITLLPGINVGKLPPIIASTFTTRSPDNTPLTNCASTSANPNLVISPAFVKQTMRFLNPFQGIVEGRGRAIKFKVAPNRDGSRVERESDSKRPSERRVEEGGSRGGNLPPLMGNLYSQL